MNKNNRVKNIVAFLIMIFLLISLFFVSINVGSLKMPFSKLLNGIFISYEADVQTIIDVRFPRIIIAILSGIAIAVSGTLLQSVMKNPLTDPGIIGISSSSALVGLLVTIFIPKLYFSIPLISMVGGILAYILIYSLAWDGGANPTKLILVGVALNMTFMGISQSIFASSGANGVTRSIIDGNIVQKNWTDVKLLLIYVAIGMVLAFLCTRKCDLLNLDDATARALGVNVDRDRFIIAVIAILLASITTSVVGVIGFLGLLVPHIGRIIVGSKHSVLLPFVSILGAFVLLLSDTIGRSIAYPYEIPAALIMAVFGGPFFVLLLKVGGKTYEN